MLPQERDFAFDFMQCGQNFVSDVEQNGKEHEKEKGDFIVKLVHVGSSLGLAAYACDTPDALSCLASCNPANDHQGEEYASEGQQLLFLRCLPLWN